MVAGMVALAAPAAAHASTKTVFMGVPPASQKGFQPTGSDVNDFFPHGTSVRVGDSIKFVPVGFHTVDFPAKGGLPIDFIAPSGQKVSGENDAAGQPFWFNGQDVFGVNTTFLTTQNFGRTVTYNGTKRAESGGPFANKPKPFTVKFKKQGSFTYYCDIHPGMTGKVTVKSKKGKVPTKKADAKVVKTQVNTALTVAKGLAKKHVPANTVDVGEAGPHGVEFYGFLPGTVTVPVGTTLNFHMTKGSYEDHTATTGPGDPNAEPDSYLGKLAASFQGAGPFPGQAIYPSDAPGAAAALTPTFHGNGFWSSGVMDTSNATPLPATSSVKFSAAGTYQFYCLIHPFMHGTVTVQ
jgi:plastocyanin